MRCRCECSHQVQCRRDAYRANHTSAPWDHLLGGAITKLFFSLSSHAFTGMMPALAAIGGLHLSSGSGSGRWWPDRHREPEGPVWSRCVLVGDPPLALGFVRWRGCFENRKADQLDDAPRVFVLGVLLWQRVTPRLCPLFGGKGKQAPQHTTYCLIERYLPSSCRSATSQPPSPLPTLFSTTKLVQQIVMIP